MTGQPVTPVPDSTPAAPAVTPPAAPVVVPPVTEPLPQAPPPLELPDAPAPGEKDGYERRFHSMQGTLKTQRDAWAVYEGQVSEQLRLLRAQVRQLEADLAESVAHREQLVKQLENVPGLQVAAQRVPALEDRIGKLQFAMTFPSIIGQAKEVTETDEAGQEVVKRTNSVMDVLLSSSLAGAQWEAMVSDLAGRLGSAGPGGSPAQPLDMTTPGGAPPPPTSSSMEELEQQRMLALQEHRYDDAQGINDQIADLMSKQQ